MRFKVVKALIGNMGEILEIEEDVLDFGRFCLLPVKGPTQPKA